MRIGVPGRPSQKCLQRGTPLPAASYGTAGEPSSCSVRSSSERCSCAKRRGPRISAIRSWASPAAAWNCLLEPPSFGSESDHTSPSVDRIGHTQQIPVSFQVPKQVVDRLFRDPHPVCKLAWTYSLEARIAPEPDVRRVQIVESCRNDPRIQLITDPLPHDTEHGADVRASFAVGVKRMA